MADRVAKADIEVEHAIADGLSLRRHLASS